MKTAAVSAEDSNNWHFSVSKKFVLNNKISVGARLLLIVMRSYVGSEGDCFPSRKLLCDKMGVGKDTLSKWLEELELAGHLERHQVRENNGFGRNTYRTSFSTLCPKKQDTENQATESQATENRTLSITTIQEVPLLKELPVFKRNGLPTANPSTNASMEKGKNREISDAWCERFQMRFNCKYHFEGGKDGKAVSKLVSFGMPVAEIMEIAEKAWDTKDDRFLAGQSKTIAGFVAQFNVFQAQANDKPYHLR